jgi:hypothetical protein
MERCPECQRESGELRPWPIYTVRLDDGAERCARCLRALNPSLDGFQGPAPLILAPPTQIIFYPTQIVFIPTETFDCGCERWQGSLTSHEWVL